MDVIFDILKHSLSSILWGIIISLACIGLFVLIVKGWYKNAMFSCATWFVLAILFLFLSLQCTMIVGSIQVLGETDEFELTIKDIVDKHYTSSEIVRGENSKAILYQMMEGCPLLKYYVADGEFIGFTASQLPHAMASELHSFLTWYIFRRLLWCLVFVLAAAFLTIKSLHGKIHKQTRNTYNRQRHRIHTRY